MPAPKFTQQQLARDLFLQTDKTQTEIAEILNVNRKTIFLWSKRGKWEQLKIAARQTPSAILQDIYNHIEEVNKKIRNREDKCPKMKEVEKLRKLLGMTTRISKKNTGNYIEAFEELTFFIAKKDYKLCREVTKYADEYVRGTFGDESFHIDQRIQENMEEVARRLKEDPVPEDTSEIVDDGKKGRICLTLVDGKHYNGFFPFPLALHDPQQVRTGLNELRADIFEKHDIETLKKRGQKEVKVGQDGATGLADQINDKQLKINAPKEITNQNQRPIFPPEIKSENETIPVGAAPGVHPNTRVNNTENPPVPGTAAYYATLPPSQRPAPFREGNIIWINHPKDLDDYEKHMKMSDTVRYYPDMDPAHKYL